MKYNPKLIEQYAKSIPGEQTILLGIDDIVKENGYTKYRALSKHPVGMPVSAVRDDDGELYIIQRDGLCHALITGSTGCGKSFRYLMSCIFNLDGKTSAIIADVKGELYRHTASYLKSIYGEENVLYMDFIKPENSQIFFNPIADIARRYLEAELYPDQKQIIRNEALADLKKLFDVLFPIQTKDDLTWSEGAKTFIYGLVYGLFEDMLLTKEQEKATERRRIIPEQINFETIMNVYNNFEYSNDEDFDDHGFFSSRDKHDPVWQYVRGIINDHPRTRACYMQIIEGFLNDYSYPDICRLTITDNFDIKTLGDKPQVIFLKFDMTAERMKGFVNQYIVKALDSLKNKAIEKGSPLNTSVMFLIDEFATLQTNNIYPTIFSVGRGLGLFLTSIVQDFTQLETAYSCGVAQQIRNNCSLTFFLSTNDINTAKAVKEQIGKHVIPDPANYLQGGLKFSENYVVSEDELLHRIKPGETYITINNHMPLKGYFELYFDCPEYLQYPESKNEKKPSIDFDDKKYHYDVSWMKIKRYKRSMWS